MSKDTLADVRHPIVQVACRYCERRGQYHLNVLIKRYGAHAQLDEVLRRLTADCTASLDRTGKRGCNGAYWVGQCDAH